MKAVKTRKSARREAAGGRPGSGNRKVLVVDHDRELTHLLATELRRWGYVALQANAPSEAARMTREGNVDAAVIGVETPSGDGVRMLQTLMEGDEHIVAVIMTSFGDLDGARQAMRLGAYDYITKPFDLRALRATLKAGLKEAASGQLRLRGRTDSSTVLTTSRC